MGTFYGHATPGCLLLFLGLWNFRCSVLDFLASPQSFAARVWHPMPLPGHWARMQLYAVVGGGSAYMITELINIFIQSYVLLNSYEHLSANVVFVLTYGVLLLHDTTRYLPFPKGTLHIIASVPYTSAAVMFFFHSTGHNGPIEARYHIFLVLLISATALMLLLSAAFPKSFLLDTLSNLGIILQGAWLLVTGASLYGYMQPSHCHTDPTDQDYKLICEEHKWEHMGLAFAYVHLAMLICLVLVLTVAFYALAARNAPSNSIDFILGTNAPANSSNPSGAFVTSAASSVVHPWPSEGAEIGKRGQATPMAAAIVDVEGEAVSLLGDKECHSKVPE
ncbi:unnamed protein product [Closterium sp. Yama58-4]|nr:unnamed protein product [Closterium sp. Yama58-4]